MNYWLLKTEPDTFGIDHLAKAINQTTPWEGVRNYQARNMMRDDMRQGDLAFFYHSSCKVPGIAGIVTVVREAYPDETSWDPNSSYFDPKSSLDHPRWFRVDVKLLKKFDHIITLTELRKIKGLQDMCLLQRGSRLSVQPVRQNEWQIICDLL